MMNGALNVFFGLEDEDRLSLIGTNIFINGYCNTPYDFFFSISLCF